MSSGLDDESPVDRDKASSAPARDLPRLSRIGDVWAPTAPIHARDTGLDPVMLGNLILKAAYTVPQFTAQWAAQRLRLPQTLLSEVFEQHRTDHLLDVLGQAGPFGFRYAITKNGRERVARLLEISGYIGPAPVTLASYAAMMDWQVAQAPEVTKHEAASALAELVLDEEDALLAGLAASSGRSLFIFGPPGNGKTSLGRALHSALRGDLWIPHCIAVEENIIRVFDPQLHHPAEGPIGEPWALDQRWVRVRRPLVVGGGEMTLNSCDLVYSEALRYYEAPLHLKANGGTFLIDDFGRQRVDPHELLNRWIIPLEHRVDYLTMHTGQKIQVPLRQFLVIATNLDLDAVTDPAFLRRMGYRLYLGKPTPVRYAAIFERYARGQELPLGPDLVVGLLNRYQAEKRELRCCEPRDLIERARDICRFTGRLTVLDDEVMNLAWDGYFGRPESAR
jgi:hypothetical protein